jgi:hypothetical protein
MRFIASVLAIATLAAPAIAAAPAPVMPLQFRGSWVLVGGNCTAGVQMEGVLTVQPRQMYHGETEKTVLALRRGHARKYAVDTRNDTHDAEEWTETALLTLAPGGQRLTLEQTRENGRLLRQRRTETFKRCP